MTAFFKKSFLLLSIFTLFTYSTPAKAEMDSRVKALLIMAGYGTIGGALLGTASLAFGTSGRSVAKGASLGLYAGILFGSYVVLSHYVQKQRRLNPEQPDPYYEDEGAEEEEGGGGLFGVVPRWQEYEALEKDSLSYQNEVGFFKEKAHGVGQDIYVNVLNIQF